ncbi:phasin family protein [Dyella silvae]|uniref:phasin family protein n=1 Tax=Dyella silvae TaxID=2994424 RepID=UPI002263F586|nr:phasin family protein [Dyella silvae]
MTTQSDLALNLYKVNSELQLRISKLVMENWKKWLELSTRVVDDGIAESQARVEQLLRAQDWAALSTLPSETFWRLLQQRMGDSNLTNHIAANVQAHFAKGLQEAIQVWQQDTARVLGGVGDMGAVSQPWNDIMEQWGRLWPWAEGKGVTRDK